MEIKRKLAKLAPFLQSAMVVFIASLFVVSIVFAATTIGSNISTGGTLDVEGQASTSNATTSGYLYIGGDLTEPPGWDFGYGDLIAADDVYIASVATVTTALWVGTGDAGYLDLTGGDLYVQGDVEIDGAATTTSLYLSDDLTVGGRASTTGDLLVEGGTIDTATSGATTTVGLFSRDRTNSTSTVSIGDIDGSIRGCLELAADDGTWWRCWINVNTTTDAALVCATGRCN